MDVTAKQRSTLVVTPRKRRVSRNGRADRLPKTDGVTPRKRRVSRNLLCLRPDLSLICHASQEACE